MTTTTLAATPAMTPATNLAADTGTSGTLTTEKPWLYDPLAVIEVLEWKERTGLWQNVVAALRLFDAADRASGADEAELLVAAMARVSAARCGLPDQLGTPSLLLAGTRKLDGGLTSPEAARVALGDDAAWLRDALLSPDEPPAEQLAGVLRSAAHHLLVALGR